MKSLTSGDYIPVGRGKSEINSCIISSSGQTYKYHRNESRALKAICGREDRPLWGSDIWTEVYVKREDKPYGYLGGRVFHSGELAQHPNSHSDTPAEKKILVIISVGLTQWNGFPRAIKLTQSTFSL